MPFDPGIVVTQPDTCLPLLIVQVKLREDLAGSESQLKKYMWQMGCPAGLLVFPRRLFVYRNQYTEYSDDSIVCIGPFATPDDWRMFERTGSEGVFEMIVQEWLETMRAEIRPSHVSSGARAALSEHIVPNLIAGEIHVAHPRATI